MSRSSSIPSSTDTGTVVRRRRRLLGLLATASLAGIASTCLRKLSPSLAGQVLPVLELRDLDGRLQSTLDFRATPLLVNVWATWCPPCRAEMAGLDRLYRELAPHGFRLVGVSADDDVNLAREYVLRSRITFPVWHDPGGKTMTRLLGTPVIPVTLLVGRDGLVRRQVSGEQVWDAGEARTWVNALM